MAKTSLPLGGTRYGFIADKDGLVTRTYMDLVSSRSKLLIPEGIQWPEFYAWARGLYWKPLRALYVMSNDVLPYLSHLKERLAPQHFIELVSIGAVDGQVFDRHLSHEEIGWGVNRPQWKKLGRDRPYRDRPVFYFSEPAPEMESQIMRRGYSVVSGPQQKYAFGDVLVVPSKRDVPYEIYEAAATGIPTVSVSANKYWLDMVIGYPVYLDTDGVDAVVDAVVESDFRYVGIMAQDMVPSHLEFRERARRLLLGHLTFM